MNVFRAALSSDFWITGITCVREDSKPRVNVSRQCDCSERSSKLTRRTSFPKCSQKRRKKQNYGRGGFASQLIIQD
jgi:hypothetical protein